MPISNVSGSNFTTLYSSQGNANPYVPIPPSNSNVSGQNYTTLYSAGSGTAPVPTEAYGNANVQAFLAVGSDGGNTVGNIKSSGIISATGNIITDQYFIGTFLGNITGNFVVPGFNTQVIYNNNGNAAASSGLTFVAASNTLTSGGVVSAVGNVQGGNIRTVGQVSATGNITTANYFLGNGAFLTGLPAGYSNADVSTYLASGTNTANIITAGNISGNYILGNGSQLSGLPVQYSNANVATFLANFGSNVISTTGNVTAGYFIGNGSTLTNLTAGNIVGTVANAAYALNANAATYATYAVNTTQANYANIANSVAGANVSGTVANATYALNANAATYATSAVNATQANYANIANSVAGANVSGTVANAAYAITANSATYTTYAINTEQANYANIANSVAGANVSGTVANATYALNANSSSYANHANIADVANSVSGSNVTGIVPLAQYVTGNAQGNITSVGTLSSLSVSGNITTSANVAGAYFIGDGSALSNLTGANVSGTVANATYALNANSSSYANHANVADLANSVAGGNVVGSVAQANYANIANSVSGSNVSGSVAQANYANIANSVAGANVTGTVPLAEYVTQAAQGNITSLGTLTSLSVGGNTTSGNISAIGNIDGSNLNISNNAVILGNLTVNGNATFFNSNVVTINDKFINLANNASTPAAANGGGIGIGPIASEYATLTYNSTGNVWESNIGFGITGNVTAGYFIGNGSALSSITGANVSGTVANAAYALNAGYVTGNAQANITSVGTLTSLSVSGNITSGNITNNGTITSVGNITAPYFIGNVQGNISGNIDAAGSNTQVQFNDTGDILGASAGFTFNKTSNAVAISGNVAANNVNATNYVAFGTAGGVTTAGPGQMFWDTAEQTVSLGMNNGVTQQIGLENYFLVKASAAITDGQVVMFTGASGNNVEAAPADMSSLNFRPGYVLGVATQNIALNGTGYITAFGQVHGLNTLAYNVGDLLYLDPASTTGGLTATQPAAPNYIIQVGTVTKKSGGDGHIQIIIRINDKVDDLSDTTITSPTNGQVLTWTTGNIWKNAGITAANITAAGSNTQIQFNDGTVLGANANLTYDKATNTFSTGIVSVTGNIGSTQQTIIGTANATASATGNIVVSGKNIATDVVFSPDVSTTTLPTGGRILIGTGVAGNTSLTAWDAQNTLRGARVAIMDAYTKNNSSVVSRELSTWSAVSLDGNITTGTSRIQGVGAVMNFSGVPLATQ